MECTFPFLFYHYKRVHDYIILVNRIQSLVVAVFTHIPFEAADVYPSNVARI
jgi:hypothetical protein